MRSVKKSAWLVAVALCGATFAHAGLVYTCDPSIDATEAGTCNYLNTVIAPLYNNTFSNLTANIYIQEGNTSLGSGNLSDNFVSYTAYLAALTAHAKASGNAVELSAVAAMNTYDTKVYSSGNVEITGALGTALGFSGMKGYMAGNAQCVLGTTACYDDVLTITTPTNLASESSGTQSLYWRQSGGSIPLNAYDFYAVVEHETDEALGTSSCVNTQDASLDNWCGPAFNGVTGGQPNTPSAADLFRYSSAGHLIADASFSTTPGAYFSYNGGATNGANGATYNTLDNGNDYGDYSQSCQFVQDAEGCLGQIFNVTTDGGELNILNAEGYTLTSSVPEPGTLSLVFLAAGTLVFLRRRRRVLRREIGADERT